jgi:hypothetical protein
MRFRWVVVVGFATLAGTFACNPHKAAPGTDVLSPTDDRIVGVLYETLVTGGSMYVGKVISVSIEERKPADPSRPALEERGSLRFRIDEAIIGEPLEELELPYWWLDDHSVVLGPDWICNGPWKNLPKPGQHLLLLLPNQGMREELRRQTLTTVSHVWFGVRPGHSLVKEFSRVATFLNIPAGDEQDALFRQLCRSEWRSVRWFAQDAAFGSALASLGGVTIEQPEPQVSVRRIISYLEAARARGIASEDRSLITRSFSSSRLAHSPDPPRAFRTAFEDWYVEELRALAEPLRCKAALEGLEKLVDIRENRDFGVLLKLFSRTGPRGLEVLLRRCAEADDESIAKRATALLEKLGWSVR